MNDEVDPKLLEEAERLRAQIEELQKLDLDAIFATTGRRSGRKKSKYVPDWVKKWDAKSATQPAQHIVREGVKELPVVVPPVKERAPVNWPERPETDFVGIGPGRPLVLRDEGAPKPKRKQMTAMNKVWKYRNFQYCGHCSEYYTAKEAEAMGESDIVGKLKKGTYDTWEARNDPHGDGPQVVHAEIWCHTCGAIDYEVSEKGPANIGSWAPPRESEAEIKLKQARHAYRWERAIYALVQGPKTAPELCIWFREVEKYEGVDFVLIGLQLKKMQAAGLVVFHDGKWWEREDHEFETERKKTK